MDLTIFMDIQANPGPGLTLESVNDSWSNTNCREFNSRATTVKYSRSQLFDLRSKYQVSDRLYCLLKDRGILRSRGIRSGISVRQKNSRISIILRDRVRYCSVKKGANLHNLCYVKRADRQLQPNALNLTGGKFEITTHATVAVHSIPVLISYRQRDNYKQRRNFSCLKKIQRNSAAVFNRRFTSCLLNARSVCNKTLIIKDFVVDYEVDLMGITETWLHLEDNDVIIGELCPNGFRLVHTPRPVGRGGGVGLLYKHGISTKSRVAEHSFRSFECTDVTFINRKTFRAIVVYRPPDTGAAISLFFEEFSSLLEEVTVSPEELVIMGDFNFHMDDTDHISARRFGSLLDLFNLKQHVTVPTHKHGHILDLIITRTNSDTLGVNNVNVLEQFISDHKAICFTLELDKIPNERRKVVSRRLKNFEFETFNDMISSSGLLDDKTSDSLESLVDKYDIVLRETLDKLAPLKSRTIVIRPNAPWYNEDIAAAKRERRKLERKWRVGRLECDRLSHLEQCNSVNAMLYRAKEQHYSAVIQENAHDTKLLFRTIDKLLQKSTEKRYPFANNDQELANAFADFFSTKIENIRDELLSRRGELGAHPNTNVEPTACSSRFDAFDMVTDEDVLKLVSGSTIKSCSLDPLPAIIMQKCYSTLVPVFRRVINLSLSTGSMPNDLKVALLLPLLKKINADFEIFASFRPVSNLKFLSKLVEKSVFAQLNNYLTTNDLHELGQSAYKTFHSTETALLSVTNDIMLSLDRGKNVFLLLLDLSAAFDTVNHSMLLTRLEKSFGVTGTALRWFQSYLSDRTQSVNIKTAKSTVRDLTVGVPQGSVLGPVLYLLYTSPLAQVIRSYDLDYHLYADDTQLYFSFNTADVDEAKTRVENCVAAICRWMDINELKLNHDKTEVMLIHSKYRNGPSFDNFNIGDETLPTTASAKSLGVIFDEHMSFDAHVSGVCKSSFYHLRNLSKIRKYLTKESSEVAVHAFVTSKLDYCNSLLYGSPKYQLKKLQRVQNTAARIVCHVSKFQHITPVLIGLHWLPVNYRIIFKVLLLVYKSLNGTSPSYLVDKLRYRTQTQSLRSVTNALLDQPKSSTKTYGDRAFSVCAPRLWNDLPLTLRRSDSIDNFKKGLKTYLFKQFLDNGSLFL